MVCGRGRLMQAIRPVVSWPCTLAGRRAPVRSHLRVANWLCSQILFTSHLYGKNVLPLTRSEKEVARGSSAPQPLCDARDCTARGYARAGPHVPTRLATANLTITTFPAHAPNGASRLSARTRGLVADWRCRCTWRCHRAHAVPAGAPKQPSAPSRKLEPPGK